MNNCLPFSRLQSKCTSIKLVATRNYAQFKPAREPSLAELRRRFPGKRVNAIVNPPIENTYKFQGGVRDKNPLECGYVFVGPILTKHNMPKYYRNHPKALDQFHPYYVQDAFEKYRQMIVMQYVNIDSNSMNRLRAQLRKEGGSLKMLKSSVVRDYIKEHPRLYNMFHLFHGSICVCLSNRDTADLAPTLSILRKNDNLLVLAGKFDDDLVPVECIDDLVKMPPKSQFYSEIAGLLSSPASRLVQTLESPSQQLVANLSQMASAEAEN